jgi:protein-tyrosine phosphatase
MRGLWVQLRRLIDQLRSQSPRMVLLAAYDKLHRFLTGEPVWRFSWITPNILLGAQPARELWPKLSRLGVTAVVNMRKEFDYQKEIGDVPVDYLYLPTEDNTPPTLEHLKRGASFVKLHVDRGGKVYIHCWEGLGRGPTMVATHFVAMGDTPDEAWARIRKVRPFIRPTQTQQERLVEYADILLEAKLSAERAAAVKANAGTGGPPGDSPAPTEAAQ